MRPAGWLPAAEARFVRWPNDAHGIVDAFFVVLLGGAALAALLTVGDLLRHQASDLPEPAERRERAELRRKAQFDKGAAVALRARLTDDLKRHEAVRRDLQRGRVLSPDLLALMESLERADRSTRQQLVEVEVWLARGG